MHTYLYYFRLSLSHCRADPGAVPKCGPLTDLQPANCMANANCFSASPASSATFAARLLQEPIWFYKCLL